MQVAPNVTRLGSPLVNWYVVEEAGRVTVVDAGAPGYRPQLDAALRSLGRRLDDVDAVVLTHAHPDHVGVAELLRREAGTHVFVHRDDERLATTAKATGKNEGSPLPYLRHAAAWKLLWDLGRNGALRPRPIREVTTFADGDELDVPGRPWVIHTPGHTDGHCALLFRESGALFVGDALCTYHPLTGERGPQLMPKALTRNLERALASLERLAEVDAGHVLPGHGEPWTEGVRAAAERAREIGPT